MTRKPRESGKDSFELSSDKVNKLHDDRAYCMALAGYALQCLRRDNITNKKTSAKIDDILNLPIKSGNRKSIFGE